MINQSALKHPAMTAKTWLLLVVLSVLWGGSFFFIKIVLREFQPLTVVFGRVVVAAIALILFVYLSNQRMPASPRVWGQFVVIGLLNNLIPFSLIVWGETQIDSSLAAILNATTPVFAVVFAHFLTPNEQLTSSRLIGILSGLGGVILLVGPEVLYGLNLQGLGQLAVLGAAISYSFAGLYGRCLKHCPPAIAAAGMLTATAVMMLPLVLIFEHPWTAKPEVSTWIALLGLGLFCTAIAYLLYFQILAIAGATNLLLVAFLIPVSALLLGVLILNERLAWNAIAGMVLIFVGLVAIDGRFVSKRSG